MFVCDIGISDQCMMNSQVFWVFRITVDCLSFLASLCLILLFVQPSATENGLYDYTRSGNPTRDALERFDHDLPIGLCFVWQL